jgi:hypothetical protein
MVPLKAGSLGGDFGVLGLDEGQAQIFQLLE